MIKSGALLAVAFFCAATFAEGAALAQNGDAEALKQEMSAQNRMQRDDREESDLDRERMPKGAVQLAKEEQKPIEAFRKIVEAGSNRNATEQIARARAAAKSASGRYVFNVLLLQHANKVGDAALRVEATDGILASGMAPPEMLAALYKNQGVFATTGGDLAKAEAAFAKVVELSPQDLETMVFLAQIKSDLGKHGEAVALFDRAIASTKAANQPVPADWERAAAATRLKIASSSPAK